MTPLHWAAARGHEAAARALLAAGADARARCKFRKTPRCLALRARAPRLVRLLDDALAQQELAASLRPIAPGARTTPHIPHTPHTPHGYKAYVTFLFRQYFDGG